MAGIRGHGSGKTDMIGIFTGLGAGTERGSGNVLGGSGLLGSGTLGRSGERVLLNAATGNLLIQQKDEMLVGRGPDAMVGRTYNSLGDLSDENGDNWRMSTDRRVYGLTGTANATGSTVKRVSADGSEVTYTWNSGASAYLATDGAGAYDKLVWTPGNSTWTWTDGDSQATETYDYAATGGRYLISKATDTKGNALAFSYLTGGKLNRATTADGGYTQYTWSGNNITQITTGYTDLATSTAKTLTRTRYGYDGSNRLTTVTVDLSPTDNAVTDGKTYVTTYAYDGTSKRVSSITQTDGSSLAITYDTSARVKTMVQTASTGVTRTTSIDYQAGFTNVTDPTGQVTRMDYDAKGQLTKITAPAPAAGIAAQVTQFAYNANGDLTSVVDPLGYTTTYASFTAFGAAQTVTDRLNNAVTRTFGAKNELLTETMTGADQSGGAVQHTTRYVYDSSDRVRFELSPDGNVVEHRYDDANGGVETATLAYAGTLYNLSSLTATQTPTLAQMTTWAAGTDQTLISKRTFTYDARGNMTGSAGYGTLDAAGNGTAQGTTFYTYDQAGQLLSTNTYAHSAQTYVYDGLGRITSSVDLAGGTTSFVFNDAATSTVVTMANGLVRTSTFNKAGDLVSVAESGANTTVGTATSKYDALGRMRMTTDATAHNSYVVYDKAGRKVADVDHYGMLTEYRYDADDRIAASITYNAYVTAAQLTTLADPLAAIDMSTLRPAANAKDMWTWRVYDKEARVLETIDGTGHAVQYEYDASGHLVRTTAFANVLTAGTLGTLKSTPPSAVTLPTANAARDAVTRTFYDKSGRVVGSLDGEGYLSRIDYDAAGRKVAETAFGAATTLANRASGSFATLSSGLASAAVDRTVRYVYDGQGLPVFTVDALNQVTESVYPNGAAADVNGLSRQTIRYAGAIATPTAWTAAGVRSALTSAGLTGNAGNRSNWAVYDARDNLTYEIDGAGGVVAYKYDASGNVTKVTRFATVRATTALPDTAAMDAWATANAAAAADRVVRNYYNARNELRYVVDGEGYVTRNDYDAEGRSTATVGFFTAISVSDATTFAQVAAAATGAAITTATAYDNDGRVASTTDGTGAVTSYVYDAAGGMLGKLYRANGTTDQVLTQYAYDNAGRVLSRTEASGATEAGTTSYTYDGLGNVTASTDPMGNATSYTYDRAGRRLTSSDPEGFATSFQYNAFDELVATVDPRGNVDYTYYDTLGRATMTRGATGDVTGMAYNVFGEVASMTRYANKAGNAASASVLPTVAADAARDATETYAYDKAGRVVTTTDAELAVTTETYNAFGEVATRNDPLDARTIQTKTTYDRRGLMKTRIVDAAAGGKALTTTWGYDAFGRAVTLVDANNATTIRTYDNEDRLLTSKDALNSTTTYAYDRRGNLAAVTDALGSVTRYAYDKRDRQVYSVDALGYVVQTAYDKNGNVVISTEFANAISLSGLAVAATVSAIAARVNTDGAADRTTHSVYDKDDRLRFSADAAGDLTEYVYDAAGNVVRTVDYAEPITNYPTYSIVGMVNTVSSMTAENIAASPIARSVYDAAGRRTFAIDAQGFVTGYAYDARGNVVAQTRYSAAYAATDDPSDGAMATWVAGHTGAADRTSRALYDRDDRLRFDVDAEGYATQYVYNQASQMAQTIRYADRYPAIGAATTVAQAVALVGSTPPATAEVVGFVYDTAGRLDSRVVDPGAGRLNITTGYSYDGNGNVVAETDGLGQVTRYVYDAVNRRILTVDAEGDVTRTSYDAVGRVVATRRFAARIARATLDGYPKQITAAQAQVAAGPTDRVDRTLYDADGRQVYSVDGEGYVTERRYDAVDNVTSMIRYAAKVTVDDTVTRASLAALLPAAIPDTAIVTGYAYDLADRLVQRTDDQGATKLNRKTGYAYDADGNVVATTDASGRVTRYVYDKLDRQVWVVDAAGYAAETRYDAFGGARTTVRYANAVASAATRAAWPSQISSAQVVAGLVASPDDRTVRSFRDRDGRTAYAIDGEGFATESRYDAVGSVVATIRYASPIAATDAMSAAEIAALLPASIPADAASTTYAYDRANRLTGTTDAAGSVTHFALDAAGQIVGTTRAYGTADASTTSRTFDRAGRLTRETRAVGTGGQSATDYGYNAFGDAITTTDPLAGATRSDYDNLGRTMRDYAPVDSAAGNDLLTSKVYDAFGRVVQATDPRGNVGYFHYDALDRLTVQIDPEGYVTRTTYTATGEKESVTRYANRSTSPGNAVTTPVIAASPADAVTTFAYDDLDRLVAATDAQGFVERYALNAFGDRIATTNKLGGVVFDAFDRRGLLVTETTQIRWVDPAQNLPMGSNITNTYAYDSRGNLKTRVEGAGRAEARTTAYAYDGLDRLTSTTHDAVAVLADAATGAVATVAPVESTSYDLRGNVVETRDAAGARTLFYYDGQDRKIAEVNAVGTLTTWQYDGNGNALLQRVHGDPVVQPATAGGSPPPPVSTVNVRETVYAYDRNNRLTSTTVATVTVGRYDGAAWQSVQGLTTSRLLDGLGNVVRETDGNGGSTFHYFDKLGREIAKVDPERYLTTWQRDAEGNVTLERRYAGRVAGAFDQNTAVATLLANTPSDPVNDRQTAFAYNRNGQRTQETRFGVGGLMDGATGATLANADAVIRYTYNALGEVLAKYEATGAATSYAYDDAGRLVRQQDAAIASLGGLRHTTDFTYDALNNLVATREGASANTSAPDAPDPFATTPVARPVTTPATTTRLDFTSADGLSNINGTAGNDYIYAASAGNGGSNSIGVFAGNGDDWVVNEAWNGQIDGGAGNDVLEFRATSQTATGGVGSDVFIFDVGNYGDSGFALDPGSTWATITDFAKGVDKIAILNIARSFSDLTLTQTGANVTITMQHAPKIVVKNMTVANLTASDFIIARDGAPSAMVRRNVVLPPVAGSPAAPSQGTAANDLITSSNSIGAIELIGGGGDDHLISASYEGLVVGGDGDDLLESRASDVTMIGGGGNDTFLFDIGTYAGEGYSYNPDYVWGRIVGFTSGRDRIAISRRTYADLTLTQVGKNVEITMAGAPRIIVELTTLAELSPSDFLFPGTSAATAAPTLTAAPTTTAATPAAEDRVTTFAYGAGGRLASQTDASGFVRNFAYDAVGRVVRESYDRQRSNGAMVTEGRFTGYDAVGRVSSEYAATLSAGAWIAGDVTSTTFNAFGDAVARNVNGSAQEISRHDTLGRVVKSNGGDGVWREYTYDGNGNVTLTVASNGFATDPNTLGDLTARGLSGAYDATVTYTTYDKRNLATGSFELQRQIGPQADGTSFTSQTIVRRQVQNAFGEVVQETDARNAVTDYRYNTLGKLVERNAAVVTVVDEHGVATAQRPTERYYYDLSGRMVGTDDANGRRTYRTLFEGSGYGEDEALVAVEHRPDTSTWTTEYDVFGDARATVDGLNRRTDQVFDKVGRLIAATRPAGAGGTRLTDYYAYDGLGQRIRHGNSFYAAPAPGQTYPYYDADMDGTFYMSPSGPYIVMGDQGGVDGTYGGMTTPVTYPSPGPDGGTWDYDTTSGLAMLSFVQNVGRAGGGGQTNLLPTDPGDGGGGGGGGGGDGGSGGGGGYYPGTDGGFSSGIETTDYDRQGRVIATSNFAGDVTSYAYAWNGSLNAGLGVTGGWTRTTSTIADRAGVGAVAATDSTDAFGHLVARTDMGGHAYAYGFDLGGHSVSEVETVGGAVVRSVSNTYYNTGRLGIVAESGGKNETFGYDANGNKVYELLSSAAGSIQQNGRATYDALNRMTSYRDQAGDGGADTVRLGWSYDAVGNIRSLTQSYRPMDPTGLSGTATADQTLWYQYDTMNRVTISQGTLVGSGATASIVRGWGVELTYDAAGQRMTATTAAGQGTPGYAPPGSPAPTTNAGAHREIYGYSDDGYLTAVDQADADGNGLFATPVALARYTRDALGRTLAESNYDAAGANVERSRSAIRYDNRDQVLGETDVQRQGSDTFTSNTSNFYSAAGTLSSSSTQSWKSSGGTTSNDTTSYAYLWRDGALTSQVTLSNTDGTTQSLYVYDNAGRLNQVQLTGGARPRTVQLTTDLGGQILTRDEVSASSLNPHSRTYVFDGVVQGSVNNDGTDNKTFAAAIAEGTVAPPTSNPGAFRNGAAYGSSYANFDRQHDAINPTSAQSAGSTYTVRAGDTLASIAQAAWGDANLWYMIAGANGLSGAEALAAGRTLSIPNKVVNRGNTSDTFRPYDPNEALGDVQPNTPTPKPQGKKKNKCGVFGAILLAVVAVAVTVVTSGAILAASGAVTGGLGGGISAVFGGAAAAGAATGASTGALIGAGVVGAAAGSIVSQGIGVATGLQDKFSFKGVALAALSAGVGAGIGASGVLDSLKGVVRAGVGAIASSAITQGVAVATGLQQRFSWTAVASAGVGAVVGYEAGKLFAAKSLVDTLDGRGGITPGDTSVGNYLARLGTSGASLLANAGTRSIVDGSDFGDNVTAALPDVLAQTVGDLIFNGVRGRSTADQPIVTAGRNGSSNASANADDANNRANAQVSPVGEEIVVTANRRTVTDAEIAEDRARNAIEDQRQAGARRTDGTGAKKPVATDPALDGRFYTMASSGGEGTQVGFLLGLDDSDRVLQIGRYSSDLDEHYNLNGGGGLAAHVDEQARFLASEIPSGQDRLQIIRQLQSLKEVSTASPALRQVFTTMLDNQMAYNNEHRFEATLWSVGRFSYGAVSSVVAPAAELAGDLTYGTYNDVFAKPGQRIGTFSVNKPLGALALANGLAHGDPIATAQVIQAGTAAVEKLPGYFSGIQQNYERYGLGGALDLYSGDLGTAVGTTASLVTGGGEIVAAIRGQRALAAIREASYLAEIDTAAIARLSPADARYTVAPSIVAAESVPGRVTVFRVEGTPNARFAIDDIGNVALEPGNKTIWLNFGQEGRGLSYLDRKVADGLPGAHMKSFDVDPRFLDEIRATAVPESLARRNPGAPIISRDPFPDQYGLRPDQFQRLMESVYQGTGKNVRPR